MATTALGRWADCQSQEKEKPGCLPGFFVVEALVYWASPKAAMLAMEAGKPE